MKYFFQFIVVMACLFPFIGCKRTEPPVPFTEKLALCDSLYNFDQLAEAGNLDKSSFVKYEECLCNTIVPSVQFKTDEGADLSTDKLKGKSYIFYTWNDRQAGFAQDLSYLKKLRDENKGKLEVVALSMFDPAILPPPLPTGLGSMYNITFGIEVLRTGFGLNPNFPMALFIDSKGVVQDIFTGYTYNFRLSEQERRERIDKGVKKILR